MVFFLEVVVGKAGGAHTMVAWAEYNFNKASTAKSGTLMKWKASNNASPNEMLSFSMVRSHYSSSPGAKSLSPSDTHVTA